MRIMRINERQGEARKRGSERERHEGQRAVSVCFTPDCRLELAKLLYANSRQKCAAAAFGIVNTAVTCH